MFSEYIKTMISGIKMWVSAEINKTRTHWSETKLVSLVDNKELTFEDQDGVYRCLYASNAFTNVSSGDHLYVVFDDIEYVCVCEILNGIVFCGDKSIADSGTAGEDVPPFIIGIYSYGLEISTLSTEQTHRISISMMQEIVHKLDVKYLPEIFAKRSDLDTIKAILKNKVNKVSGKGLSTNDYTTTEKNKLAGIETGANKTVVDSSLSSTSTNPVQNKIITSSFMNKKNPSGTGSFSLNRSSRDPIGKFSFAEGYLTVASGDYSHAEGSYTTASGIYSHAEGNVTTASGDASHAEGARTTASGGCSHAEGNGTTASGNYSHAEGLNTTASSEIQHVQGRYNIEDTAKKYAHIVGNGDSNSRSNAHTLDWSGNAWYAGTVEGTAMIVKSSTDGSSKRFKLTVDDTGTISATEVT